MESKGIEEMTREELINLISSLDKGLNDANKDLDLFKEWFNDEKEKNELLQAKINALKSFAKVI